MKWDGLSRKIYDDFKEIFGNASDVPDFHAPWHLSDDNLLLLWLFKKFH